jgi:outer membrane receptor protein involved in Fe transport
MKYVLTSIFALLALSAPALAGQPVQGIVLDGGTAVPIPGATVRIVGGPVTVTDKYGRFEFKDIAAGTYGVEASKPPFESITDTLVVPADAPPEPVQLLLIGEVASVAVVADAPKRPPPPAPGGAEVVREEITHVPGARGDVLTAVQSLPGMANVGAFTAFAGDGLIIRGSSPADSRVMVDGFEVPLLYHFGAVQSILPSEMVDNILYSPGGFGVEQGRASSGTISVNSRRGSAQLGGFAEVSFINGGLFLQGPIGDSRRATFAVSARRSLIDAFLPSVLPKDGSLNFTVLPKYYDWQARVDWQPADRWQLALFVFGTFDGVAFATTADNANDPALTGSFKNDTEFGRLIASATYEGPRVKNRISATGDLSRFSFDTSADRYGHFKAWGAAARDELRLQLAEPLALRAGGEYMYQSWDLDIKFPRPPKEGDPMMPSFTFDPPVETAGQYWVPSTAAWTAAEWQKGRWFLSGGARYDGFLYNHAHVVQPRGEAKVTLGKNKVRATAGLYTRPPSYNDENLYPELRPEKAWQFTLGGERELREGLTAQATTFLTERSGLIVYATNRADATNADHPYVNRGTGRTYGAELLVTWRGPNHFAWLAYTLSRSVRRDAPEMAERLFDFDQTHNLVLVGSHRFGKDKHWQVGARFQLTTGKPWTPVTGSVFNSDLNYYRPTYGTLNSERTELQHQLDVRVDRTWNFHKWRLKAFLDVQNVYLHPAAYAYQYSYDYSQKDALKTIPILPSLGVRGEF